MRHRAVTALIHPPLCRTATVPPDHKAADCAHQAAASLTADPTANFARSCWVDDLIDVAGRVADEWLHDGAPLFSCRAVAPVLHPRSLSPSPTSGMAEVRIVPWPRALAGDVESERAAQLSILLLVGRPRFSSVAANAGNRMVTTHLGTASIAVTVDGVAAVVARNGATIPSDRPGRPSSAATAGSCE